VCGQGEIAQCTLIYRPQDCHEHEAHINSDFNSRTISATSHRRQLASLNAVRAFAENVTCCRWRHLMQHWGQDDLEDASWVCGTCDVCIRCAEEPNPEPANLGDATILLLLMVESATASKARERGAGLKDIKKTSACHRLP
jgi:superfamily II DNA helicase RecQ